MPLPTVLLKAKSALKKAQTAKNIKNSISEGEEATDTIVGANKKIFILSIGVLAPFFAFSVLTIVAVNLPNQLVTIAGAVIKDTFGGGSSVNVEVGEAAKIEGQEARIAWLYDGKGIPTTEEENEKYLENFEIEYLDKNGKLKTRTMRMHKKLKSEVQAIFKDLVNIGFKLEWDSGGGSLRGWNAGRTFGGTFPRSAHCYGHAIDINVDSNPCDGSGCGHVGGTYSPGSDPLSVTDEVVQIWKKHGFYWGGDWNSLKDYMHFSYFNH